MKNSRVEIASSTLKIMEQGSYSVDGKTNQIAELIENSKVLTTLHRPTELDNLVETIRLEKKYQTQVEVLNMSTIEAIRRVGNGAGVLNFASAKNPGGGFLNGAQSQEESLARSSSLYPSIDAQQEFYKYNRSRKTYLYSDYMIYSPNVVFFKDDEGNLFHIPIVVDVITSPAANVGAILSNKPSEMDEVEETMLKRIDKLLALFASKGNTRLILGAWGCGVFRNDPVKIATYFDQFLGKGKKYDGVFEHIIYAVLDSKDRGIYRAFKQLER